MDIRIVAAKKIPYPKNRLFLLFAAALFFLGLCLKFYVWTHDYLDLKALFWGSEVILAVAVLFGIQFYRKRNRPENKILKALRNEDIHLEIPYRPSWQLYKSMVIILVSLVWMTLVLESLSLHRAVMVQPEYMLALIGVLLLVESLRILRFYFIVKPFRILFTKRAMISYREDYDEMLWEELYTVERRGSQVFLVLRNGNIKKIDLGDLGHGREQFAPALRRQMRKKKIDYRVWGTLVE